MWFLKSRVSVTSPGALAAGHLAGEIVLAVLKRSILGGVSGTSKERGAVGFTDIGGLLHNQLLTGGDNSELPVWAVLGSFVVTLICGIALSFTPAVRQNVPS
jgi:hypothetical protein